MTPTENAQRAAIVAAARSWIGTPYHNCADIKGVGVDCGMLLVRVFVDTGLCAPFDPRPYPIDWHLHRGDERYLGFIFDRGREVTEPQPGDVMVLRYGRSYAHGGIVTKASRSRPSCTPSIRRAWFSKRRSSTTRHLCDAARAPRFFSYWATEAMSGLFGGGTQTDDAGLYRPANPDRRQHAAGPDRLGRVEARAERHLVQQFPDLAAAAARAAARAVCSAAAARRPPTAPR